ncbi:ANTAR domain-containing protein [Streptomyces arenae]|nr:ANTAR domain-containing protein [Streptomyces arenae]
MGTGRFLLALEENLRDADAYRSGHDPEEGEATAEKVEELVAEAQQLKHALASHATVDQAIGIVLALGQLTPTEAWDVLRDVSMQSNTKLRTVAEYVVEWGRTGSLDGALRGELDRQLERHVAEAAPAPGDEPQTSG